MHTIEVSQSTETDEWLEARRGKITGTKASDLALEEYSQIDVDHILDMQAQAMEQAAKQMNYSAQASQKAEDYLAKATALESGDGIDVQMDEANAKISEANGHLEKVTTEKVRAKWEKQIETSTKKLNTLKDRMAKNLEKAKDLRAKAEEQTLKSNTYEAKAGDYKTKADDYGHKADHAKIENMRLKVTVGFWDFAAESLAEPPTSESPMDRGHRLENQNAHKTLDSLRIPEEEANLDPGIWVRDDLEQIACSPDAHENSLEPTWAIECKSLGSANHLMYVAPILVHRAYVDKTDESTSEEVKLLGRTILPDYTISDDVRDFDFVPYKYKGQVLQYFVVNDALQTLYFSFYDDRFIDPALQHVYLTISRESVKSEVAIQLYREKTALMSINEMKHVFNVVSMTPEF